VSFGVNIRQGNDKTREKNIEKEERRENLSYQGKVFSGTKVVKTKTMKLREK
jgi:hypothetical protein